ncbi:hypothetical protein PR048_016209 [Dryococelus australis]|uniref:Transposase n=1 Tax=Dryococelus australis TaxID=614101 RepID=A0ABQ9HJ30_9NEOP|nr:hypothetical protein PR048_016209 [Dryococelus australis]
MSIRKHLLNLSRRCVQTKKAPTMTSRKIEIHEWFKLNYIYCIGEILKEHSHEVVRLPPYHCNLDAIEYIWNIAKFRVAKSNVSQRADQIKPLTDKQEEEQYWKNDRGIEEEMENIVISLGGDSDCDCESDSSHDTDSFSDCTVHGNVTDGDLSGIEELDLECIIEAAIKRVLAQAELEEISRFPPLNSSAAPYSPRLILIGSQDFDATAKRGSGALSLPAAEDVGRRFHVGTSGSEELAALGVSHVVVRTCQIQAGQSLSALPRGEYLRTKRENKCVLLLLASIDLPAAGNNGDTLYKGHSQLRTSLKKAKTVERSCLRERVESMRKLTRVSRSPLALPRFYGSDVNNSFDQAATLTVLRRVTELKKLMILDFRTKRGSVSETATLMNCSCASRVKVYHEWTMVPLEVTVVESVEIHGPLLSEVNVDYNGRQGQLTGYSGTTYSQNEPWGIQTPVYHNSSANPSENGAPE